MEEKHLTTDVLVVGGGMAGCFAAMRAQAQGADVLLVDKGYVSRSGSTPFPRGLMVFDPSRGHTVEQWMDEVVTAGEYLNNRDWVEYIMDESKGIYEELVSWGVSFGRDERGQVVANQHIDGGIEARQLTYGSLSPILRRQVLQRGVTILDRLVVTDLLEDEDRIVGAVAVSSTDATLYVLKAKAVVLCTGAASFKPNGFPIASVTGDGVAMAYRAGAEIAGKEFYDCHHTSAVHPAEIGYRTMVRPAGKMSPPLLTDAEGGRVEWSGGGPTHLDLEFVAHAGRAPIVTGGGDGPARPMVGGAALGYGGAGEGIWPTDWGCATRLPGLFAAGECCGTFHLGAAYPGGGWGLQGAASTGASAGRAAALFAKAAGLAEVPHEGLAALKETALGPLSRKGGFSPDWVTQVLFNTVAPYFVLAVKTKERLNAALVTIEFLRDHMVPALFARDPHELRKAHETKSMVLNAEMKVRASLYRTESRGTHYREDFPRRDDPRWLAWVLLAQDKGVMKARKKPVPKKWWPDLSKPYAELYPCRFPGE